MSKPLATWAAGVIGVLFIGIIDYFSGAEVRVFPLYFAPISFVSWHHGYVGVGVMTALSVVSWATANSLAGLTFSNPFVWVANSIAIGVSFVIVGLLTAAIRASVVREHGLSRQDPLTALLNTRTFYEEAARMLVLCRRKDRPITIAYIDLDNFRDVNSAIGHEAADDLLRQIGKLLQSSLRPSDLITRLGGDEFGILLAETGPQQASAALERIHSLLSHRFAPLAPGMTSSIGAVTFVKNHPETVEAMVHQADIRRYAAKNLGGNRIHLDVVE